MDTIANKVDNTPAPSGTLPASEWNDRSNESQNAVTGSDQVLSAVITDQLLRAIGLEGRRRLISSGTADPGDTILVDNSGGSVNIALPITPATNTLVHFEQLIDEPFSTNNLIVNRNGQTIMGLAEDMTVDVDNIKFTMRFDGTTWIVLSTAIVGQT